MDTCETCEHWNLLDGKRGGCNSGKIVDGEDLHYENKKASPDMLVHQDTYNEGSYAHTGKDFGYIHHNPKGADDEQ